MRQRILESENIFKQGTLVHFIIKISSPKKIQSNSRIGVYTPSNHPKALFTAATTAFPKASDGVPVSTPVTTTQSDVLLLRRIQLQNLKPQKLHRSSVQLCRCDPWSEGNYICTSSHLQFHPHRYSTLDTMGRGRFHQSMTLWHPGMLSQRSTTKQEFRSPVGSVQSGFLKLRVFQISVSLPRTWNGWESKIPPWVSFIGSKVTVCLHCSGVNVVRRLRTSLLIPILTQAQRRRPGKGMPTRGPCSWPRPGQVVEVQGLPATGICVFKSSQWNTGNKTR